MLEGVSNIAVTVKQEIPDDPAELSQELGLSIS